MKIYAELTIGYPNAKRIKEFDFDDDATEDEINEVIDDWVNSCVEVSWKVKPINKES